MACRLLFAVCFAFWTSTEAVPVPARNNSPRGEDVIKYLHSISGKQTVSGQHNAEPNSEPLQTTDWVHNVTGVWPAFWSGDFLYEEDNIQSRWTMIHEAERQWEKGAIVHLMFHACNPVLGGEPCGWEGGVLSHINDTQWENLLRNGTDVNEKWKSMLDVIAPYLQYLKQRGVQVLLRLHHEMNQAKFWWGGRPGPNGTAALFRLSQLHLKDTHALDNLRFIWDLQDFKTYAQDLYDYNPGSDFFDILSFDNYSGDYSQDKYDRVLAAAGPDKLVAIGECASLPSLQQLHEQPRWVFFMPWPGLVQKDNTVQHVRELYSSPQVIVLKNEL